MQCDEIQVYSFFAFGDSDEEIRDNTASMGKKLLGKADDQLKSINMVSIQNQVGADNTRVEEQIRAPELGATISSTGVYLLAHGGATGTKPGADKLADLVYDDLIKTGSPVRKINLASCQGGGGKLKSDEVKSSPLSQFCARLQKRASDDSVKLPIGLMVCAYQTTVTTFDADAHFVKAAINRGVQMDSGLTGAPKDHQIRTAFTKFSKPESYSESHPKQGLGMAGDIQTQKNELLQDAIISVWNASNSKGRKKNDSTPLPELSDDKAEEFISTNWNKIIEKVRNTAFNSDKPFWRSMENYVQKKIVMRIDDGGTFKPANLSDYSDNTELKKALKIVETGMGSAKPASKINLSI